MFRFRIRYTLCLAAFCSVLVIIVLLNFKNDGKGSYYEIGYCHCECNRSSQSLVGKVSSIPCNADGGSLMQCYKDDIDIYFPFDKFLKNQFGVSGRIIKRPQSRSNQFEWLTSSAKIKYQNISSYDSHGPFGQFAYYSVETRDRVRCINAGEGVPMSTQWSSKPYFYPIQIAQFALQHYSRFKTNSAPVVIPLSESILHWKLGRTASLSKVYDSTEKNYLVQFATENKRYDVSVELSPLSSLVVVLFEWIADAEASFSLTVQLLRTKTIYELRYVQKEDNRCVWSNTEKNIFFYSMNKKKRSDNWQTMNRNFLTDLDRALVATAETRRNTPLLRPGNVIITRFFRQGDVKGLWISFSGNCSLRNVRQQSTANLDNFIVAARWFVKNQNAEGGWSVPIARSTANNQLQLSAGWHSAMAQGHGLSVLSRAYSLLNDSVYLKVAGKALKLFEMTAEAGGVSNSLFGHVWYEEYPTTPGTYVLNGFMYSLIGLYDFSRIRSDFAFKAEELFQKGVDSLKLFLPFYDTGSGSVYDLRHLSLHIAPNIARWDYHAVHIYLLKWLFGITKIKQFDDVANRWIGYAHGRRAKHN